MCSSPTAPHGGTTLTTRVTGPQRCIVSNSYKLVRAPRRLCSHWPPHRSPTAHCLQAPCPAHSYHAVPSAHKFRQAPLSMSQAIVMSSSLAEAATQLSFAEFSERCNFLRAPPPRPQPSPTLLLDALRRLFHTVLPLLMRPPNSPSRRFFWRCIYSKDPLDRSVPSLAHGNASSAALPQPIDIATTCSPSSTSRSSGRSAPRARLHFTPPPPPGLEDQAYLRSSHGILVKAAPVRLCTQSSTSAPSPQPHVRTIQVGTHADSSTATCKRSADPRARRVPFPKPHAMVSPWSIWPTKPDGSDTLILRTVTSCIINTVSQHFSGTQAQRAGTPTRSSQRLADGSMRLLFKKPVITFPTSPISSLRTLATRTSPSCSTRTPSSPTLRFSPSTKTPQAKVRWAWSYSSFAATPFSF